MPPLRAAVTPTVYSVTWPATEALVRRCMRDETEAMLDAHRNTHTRRQDAMHEPFFTAWARFAAPALEGSLDAFGEHYPTAGSSEAIREAIREMAWKRQDLVVFDGEYEGYEAIAREQGTRIHRVLRAQWRKTLADWARDGEPWGPEGAVWWVSQPSALDGNAWDDFGDWLGAVERLAGARVWLDLTYVGSARLAKPIPITSPALAGIVFSLSKVMGSYYRRIGGCLAREPIAGLWANRWFKNLDSLFIGQRWLEEAGNALEQGQRHASLQARAVERALAALGGKDAWEAAGVCWTPSDVALLMHAPQTHLDVPEHLKMAWTLAGRGRNGQAARRLCLTPTLCALLSGDNPGEGEGTSRVAP